jgi:choline-sulfatase
MHAGGLFLWLVGAGCLAATLSACAAPPAEPSVQPNVLLISIDTLRADRLGCYGARAVQTPAIDRLAASGVRFANAFSPVPLTLPAHWTIHTGVEPWRHGVVDNGMVLQSPPAPTLAERLSAAGYDTAAFVAAFVLHRTFGLARGFARYDDGPAADAALDQLLHATAPADERVGRALTWLRQPRTKPFFLWLHLYDPHAPYDPPPAFRGTYSGRPYDGEVAFVDTQIARIFAGLEDGGLADKTLVVLTSDHGESLGEHGEATHGVLLYDATLRVPLLFRLPGGQGAGAVRMEAADLADIAPSVLALAGLEPGPGLDGVDLFRDPAETPVAARRLTAISDSPRRRLGWASLVAVREGPWKYILAPRPELYRIADDPMELADRLSQPAPDDSPIARELERAARRTAAEVETRRQEGTAADSGAEERARLAALGYLSPSGPPTQGGADPKSAIGLLADLDRAHQALAEGRLEEADRSFRRLIESPPPPLAALEGLGRIARMRGRTEEAERYFERLFALDRESVVALAQLVQLARERGDLHSAVARGRQLVELAPGDGSACRLLAEALAAAGDAVGAESEWRRGLDAAPHAPWLQLSFAKFLIDSKRAREAMPILDRIVTDEEAPDEVVEAAQSMRGALPQPR